MVPHVTPLPPLPACVNQIREARFRFEEQTGQRPGALYLGKKDVAELKDWVRPGLLYSTSFIPSRAQFDGLPIFVVDAERHVGVG